LIQVAEVAGAKGAEKMTQAFEKSGHGGHGMTFKCSKLALNI